MADSATTPAVKNTVELEADVNVEFNEASSRQQINSGESVKTLFGKLQKFLTDLKPVAFSGSYADLSDTPKSLPANGGNADYATNAGNADTLSSKSIDYFMHWREETVINPDDVTNIGIYQWSTPTTNTVNPIAYGTLIVSNAFGFKCQIAIGVDASIYVRHKTYDQEWIAWRNVSDGGNADTLDGLHASDFYSIGNKPYVTGSVTVAANDSFCTTNHGFMPSAAIWWCAYSSGVGVGLSETGFAMGFGYDKDMIVHYIIFK